MGLFLVIWCVVVLVSLFGLFIIKLLNVKCVFKGVSGRLVFVVFMCCCEVGCGVFVVDVGVLMDGEVICGVVVVLVIWKCMCCIDLFRVVSL